MMMEMRQIIYCCGCEKMVEPRLTNGAEIYSHRWDLKNIPFWKCDDCGNYVGCHHKTKNQTQPLGCIPTPEIREYRKDIHKSIDCYWREGFFTRKEVYAEMSKLIGYQFHSADIRTLDEAIRVASFADGIFEGDERMEKHLEIST